MTALAGGVISLKSQAWICLSPIRGTLKLFISVGYVILPDRRLHSATKSGVAGLKFPAWIRPDSPGVTQAFVIELHVGVWYENCQTMWVNKADAPELMSRPGGPHA
jgi:hypothetical protein